MTTPTGDDKLPLDTTEIGREIEALAHTAQDEGPEQVGQALGPLALRLLAGDEAQVEAVRAGTQEALNTAEGLSDRTALGVLSGLVDVLPSVGDQLRSIPVDVTKVRLDADSLAKLPRITPG